MSFNGSGTYTLPSGNPVVSGTTISSTTHNNTMTDVANALTNTLCKDGQSTPSANLKMGGFKLTGLAAGTGAGESARWEQLFDQGTEVSVASAAMTDIGAQNSNFISVTGTTTITSFGTNYKGPRFLRFAGALSLTNSSTLVLPGSADIVTAAGDTCIAVPKATAGVNDGWSIVAYQRNVATAGTGSTSVALSSTDVTLTGAQASYATVTLTGTLSANVNVIFPTWVRSWNVVNNCTGAFTVTCKTASGTGVVVAAGSSTIAGDGTNIVFSGNSSSYKEIQTITATVASNALTLGLNATNLDFRATPLTSGTVNTRSVSALSLVVPTSATLGTVSTQSARLVLLAIDNAGTVELAVVNLAGGNKLDETSLINTTAISSSATANNVIYSTTARTGVPYRVVGFIDITEATAGTWATAPTTVQGAGGQALAAMSSLGYGQTWQAFTVGSQRSFGVTYYNTTGKPIFVFFRTTGNSGLTTVLVNGVTASSGNTTSTAAQCSFIVPPGASYIATSADSLAIWSELR